MVDDNASEINEKEEITSNSQFELFLELAKLVKQLGWGIAFPANPNELDNVPGLIIGDKEYLELVTRLIPKHAFSHISSCKDAYHI